MPTTTLTLLEPFVAPFMQHPVIRMKDGVDFQVDSLYQDMPRLVASLQQADMVREGKYADGIWTPSEHCGWIMPAPLHLTSDDVEVETDELMCLEDFWYTGGFGPEGSKIRELIANGGRKLFGLALAMLNGASDCRSTLDLQAQASLLESEEDKLEVFPGPYVQSSEDDGQTLWGVFPWGGAVIVTVGHWAVACGVSGYTAPQDHLLATTIATRFAEWLDSNEDNILEIPWAV